MGFCFLTFQKIMIKKFKKSKLYSKIMEEYPKALELVYSNDEFEQTSNKINSVKVNIPISNKLCIFNFRIKKK